MNGLLFGDPVTRLAFSMAENKGVYALLLGSGLSRSAEIPTGWEITVDLIRRVATAQGEAEQADWPVWYRAKASKDADYSDLLAELAETPAERRSILHSYIEPTAEDRTEGRRIPTAAHRSIAELVRGGFVRLIVTTNFDRLMEGALRDVGIEPTVVSTVDALSGAQPLPHAGCYVLKLHGDYLDARILNTTEELEVYPRLFDTLLDRVFDEYGLVVSGWSGEWDQALRQAMLRAPSRRYPWFWTTKSTVGTGADQIISHRKATLVTILSADAFFGELATKVETIEATRRTNPLSIDLTIASAKRFLAKPEFRIQLHDLVSGETERLLNMLRSLALDANGPWSDDEFRRRVVLYESAAEGLTKLFGVLGRWGDGTERKAVLDALSAVTKEAESLGGGLTAYLSLRSYPTVLLMYGYGIGLTASERWSALFEFFVAPVQTRHEQASSVVRHYFLNEWEGGATDVWRRLEGFDRRHTPLSDRLHDLFDGWTQAFAGFQPDKTVLFERFEYLGSLAHFSQNDFDQAKAELERHGGFMFMPFGRVAWDGQTRKKIEMDFADPSRRDEIARSGFAQKRQDMIDLFEANLGRVTSRLR